MGQLAIGLAGGALFGSPGYLAGMFIGGLLFPPEGTSQHRQGPRRDEFQISSATRGRPIPEGFGTILLPGEYIWASPVREIANTTSTSTGGKGGGGASTVTTTTYSYRADFSVAFAQGPAEAVLRVWLDNHVVYDNREPQTTSALPQVIKKPGLNMRIYLGTEDQLACPVMQAAEGVADTPAHRGTVYITFEDYDITEHGRFPQVRAEIAFKASISPSGRLSVDTGAPWDDGTEDIYVDWARDRAISLDDGDDGNPAGETEGLRVHSIGTLTEIQNQSANTMLGTTGVGISSTTPFGMGRYTGYMFMQYPGGNQSKMNFIDPDSLLKVSEWGATGPLPGLGSHGGPNTISQSRAFTECIILPPSSIGTEVIAQRILFGWSLNLDAYFMLDYSVAAAPKILGWGGTGTGEFAGAIACISPPPKLGQNRVYTLYQNGAGAIAYFKNYIIDYGAFYDPDANQIYGVAVAGITSFDTTQQGGAGRDVGGPIYDETDGNVIFWSRASGNVRRVWKWDLDLGVIKWTLDLPSGTDNTISPIVHNFVQGTRIRNGELGFIGTNTTNQWVIIDTISGTVKDNGSIDFASWRGLSSHYFWDDTYRVWTGHHSNVFGANLEQYFPGRYTGLGEPLNEVVNTLSGTEVNGAKLAASQYDTSDLASDTLRGGAITRPSSPRQYIENTLMPAFNFDATTVNGQVVFVKRNDGPIKEINEDDLVAVEIPLIKRTRTQEIELPRRLEVKFIDAAIDYEDNSAVGQRSALPIATMLSRKEASVEFPIVLTLTEAKEIADRLLHTSWVQRITFEFTVGHEHYDLVPTNVIQLNASNGDTIVLRIIETEIQVDNSIKITATLLDTVLAVNSGVTTDPVLGFEEQVLDNSAGTRLFLFDGPYLRDIDSAQRSAIELRYAMAGLIPGWRAGTLYDSEDSVNYTGVGRSLGAVSYGILTNTLPAGSDITITDTTTVLNVIMIEGELSSTDTNGYYNNVNVAAIGNPDTGRWENIIFRDVVQQANGSYDISYIGRGRRGTNSEFFTENHAAGERFVVLSRPEVDRILLELSDLNLTRYYKGVGDGEFLEQVPIKVLASTGGPLKPLKPCYLDLTVDGSENVDVTWRRSTRLNYENAQDWGDKPLHEDSELYEADILDEADAVVRTFGAGGTLSVEAIEYLKNDYKTDIAVGTGPTQLDVGSSTTFTRPAGDFVTDGFIAGMKIETTGFANGANNGIFTIATVASGTITIEESTLITETGSGDETMDALRRPDWSILIYQISAQVGRGYASDKTLLPV